MAENADGYIDFAIDDVEKRPGRTLKEIGNLRTSKNGGRSDKENQNVGNDGHGKPNLPSRQDRLLYSIASLTPLLKKFTIKVRVTQKGGMITRRHAGGSVKLFSFTVMDESGDLRITAFKDNADKFEPMIKVGEYFTISDGVLKNKNAQCNDTGSDYELTIQDFTVIEPCDCDDQKEMAKNEDGYIDFAIDDANKENQNVGNTGHGKRKLPSGHDRFVSIASLTPFMNKWTIKARVTQKGGMITRRQAGGSVKLFSFTVMDESGDLKITAFKEDADRLEPIIKVGECFTISNGVLKNKNTQCNNTASDYELTLVRSTVIEPCDGNDDAASNFETVVPMAKKLKRELKDEIETEAEEHVFSSKDFPKVVAKLSFKLTLLFDTVKETIRKANDNEKTQRSDLYKTVPEI